MKSKQTCLALLLVGMSSWAGAQSAPPAAKPIAETLEPAVNTSAATAAEKAAEPDGAAKNSEAKPAAPKQPGARAGKAMDRLELDATQITGNRELPKVMYIVPWKRSDLGDLLGKPMNSLLDEVLEPVDRDVFKRENRYYRALQPDAAAAAPTSSAPAPQAARPE